MKQDALNISYEQELVKLALFSSMPISYNGLVMENTNRCNSRCAICYQAAGEHKDTARLDLETAKRCIREAAEIETINNRFHLAGGEAFLYPEDCFAMFREAKTAGFTNITTTTNGFWAKSLDEALRICAELSESGLTSIELSWDHWHGEFISADCINNCLIACKEYEIETNLRLLTTKSHNMEESLAKISPEALQQAYSITSGPVFATGRAAEVLDKSEFYHSRAGMNDSCHSILNLTVNAFGQVFPCCAGFEMCRNCASGNIYEQPLSSIVSGMNADPMLRQIVFLGISSFLPILQDQGCQIKEDDFFNTCQMCSSIFSNQEYLAIIRRHFAQKRQQALERAISCLEMKYQEQEGQDNA